MYVCIYVCIQDNIFVTSSNIQDYTSRCKQRNGRNLMNLININIIKMNSSHTSNATGKNKELSTVLCTMSTRNVKHKSETLLDYFCKSGADIFALTETWLNTN